MKVEIELTNDQAWAYADFLKHLLYSDYCTKTKKENTEYAREAGRKIEKVLEEAGFAQR